MPTVRLRTPLAAAGGGGAHAAGPPQGARVHLGHTEVATEAVATTELASLPPSPADDEVNGPSAKRWDAGLAGQK